MTKKLLFILCALFISTQTAQAQTWNIGYPNAEDVTATLNTTDSTLTISGTGNMQNFRQGTTGLNTPVPWFSLRGNIKTVIIEQGITNIGNQAFEGCANLTSVIISYGVTNIGTSAFADCVRLTEIDIPNSVTTIGSFAFARCTSLTSIVIPNSVTIIGIDAFRDCTALASVIIGESVTNIGSWAFAGCTSLTSIMIPSSVTSIGSSVFNGCTNLTAIDVDTENPAFSSENGVLFNKNKTGLIRFPQGKQVTDYSIPNSVTDIWSNAFDGCANLTNIVIPNSVTNISAQAFRGCTSLTSIVIPNSVTRIGWGAFDGCRNLSDIYVYWDTPPSIVASVFQNINIQNVKLHIPHGTLSAYQNAPVWQDFILVERAETSVDIVENDNVKLHTTANGILIETREEVQVAVFSISGALLYQSTVFGSREIALPAGVYVVRVNGESEKVIVR